MDSAWQTIPNPFAQDTFLEFSSRPTSYGGSSRNSSIRMFAFVPPQVKDEGPRTKPTIPPELSMSKSGDLTEDDAEKLRVISSWLKARRNATKVSTASQVEGSTLPQKDALNGSLTNPSTNSKSNLLSDEDIEFLQGMRSRIEAGRSKVRRNPPVASTSSPLATLTPPKPSKAERRTPEPHSVDQLVAKGGSLRAHIDAPNPRGKTTSSAALRENRGKGHRSKPQRPAPSVTTDALSSFHQSVNYEESHHYFRPDILSSPTASSFVHVSELISPCTSVHYGRERHSFRPDGTSSPSPSSFVLVPEPSASKSRKPRHKAPHPDISDTSSASLLDTPRTPPPTQELWVPNNDPYCTLRPKRTNVELIKQKMHGESYSLPHGRIETFECF